MFTKDDVRYVRSFIELHGNLEYAKRFARSFKKCLSAFYMDAREKSPDYEENARRFWHEVCSVEGVVFSKGLIDKLSGDKDSPAVYHGIIMGEISERGYKGGDREIDDLCNDLASGGALS